MPGIILTLKTVDRSALKGLGLSYARMVKQTLYDTAEHWHKEIFPSHFGPQNQGKYQYAPRTAVYLQKIKRLHGVAEGKFRIQVLQGKSGRALRNLVRISGSSRQATVRMSAPGHFTNPFVGSWVDAKTGRVKRVTRQPNKPEEIVRKSATDREKLRAFSTQRLAQLITTARNASARNWAADGI
jgi:hypothetical protein